jgi:predicted TIM-barrel fold metal-dependent hydrolase
MHIFDPPRPRAPGSTGAVAEQATAADYQLLQRRLGTARAVVVTPRYYGTDNGGTIDAIRILGRDRTRGIAVVAPDISDQELLALRNAGICGVRYTTPHIPVDSPVFGHAAALAPRLDRLGMHLQLHWTVEQTVAHADLLHRLPCTVVIDHMGRLPKGIGLAHPANSVLRRRLDDGRTWVKLSGWYLDSAGPPYADTGAVAASFVKAAPERMVWGTDWPHVSVTDKPDGAAMLDMLLACVPDESLRRRILVDNPARLYGFGGDAS